MIEDGPLEFLADYWIALVAAAVVLGVVAAKLVDRRFGWILAPMALAVVVGVLVALHYRLLLVANGVGSLLIGSFLAGWACSMWSVRSGDRSPTSDEMMMLAVLAGLFGLAGLVCLLIDAGPLEFLADWWFAMARRAGWNG